MLNFKRFDPENFKTDMSGNIVKTNVIFLVDDVLRFGYVFQETIIGDNYYIFSGEEYYLVKQDTLYCEISVDEV